MPNQKSEIRNPPRIHWLDALRGVFVLMMIATHFAFDLAYFSNELERFPNPAFDLLAKATQIGFLTVVGISLFISHSKSDNPSAWLRRMALRALQLFGVSLCITITSWIIAPDAYIRFGILHLISAGILVGALIIPSTLLTFATLILSLGLGTLFASVHVSTSLLVPFGLTPSDFSSFDYFPVFPWLSVVLAGILLGQGLDSRSLLKNPHWLIRSTVLEKFGRHSLLIYLGHQPILLLILWLFFRFR